MAFLNAGTPPVVIVIDDDAESMAIDCYDSDQDSDYCDSGADDSSESSNEDDSSSSVDDVDSDFYIDDMASDDLLSDDEYGDLESESSDHDFTDIFGASEEAEESAVGEDSDQDSNFSDQEYSDILDFESVEDIPRRYHFSNGGRTPRPWHELLRSARSLKRHSSNYKFQADKRALLHYRDCPAAPETIHERAALVLVKFRHIELSRQKNLSCEFCRDAQ